MENLITSTALTALATEVGSQFVAILESLTEIETRAAEAYTDIDASWKTDYNSATLRADRNLAYSIHDAAESVRRNVASYQERLLKATRSHVEAYDELELKRKTQLNIEIAKTATPIESGYVYLSAHVNLAKGKPTDRATVLYMLEGVVYAAEVINSKNELFITSGWADEPSAVVKGDGSSFQRKFYFGPEMTAEEIGKAAHLKEKVIQAAWEQFNNLSRKRRA